MDDGVDFYKRALNYARHREHKFKNYRPKIEAEDFAVYAWEHRKKCWRLKWLFANYIREMLGRPKHNQRGENARRGLITSGELLDQHGSGEHYGNNTIDRELLRNLKPIERAIVILTYEWGFNQSEVGDCFGVTFARIHQRLKTIQEKLSKTLQPISQIQGSTRGGKGSYQKKQKNRYEKIQKHESLQSLAKKLSMRYGEMEFNVEEHLKELDLFCKKIQFKPDLTCVNGKEFKTLRQLKDMIILHRLDHFSWNISHTARSLGISIRGLRYYVRRYEKLLRNHEGDEK